MNKKDRPLEGDGFGGSIQLVQIKAGQRGETTGADDIDVSDMKVIEIIGSCDVYAGVDSAVLIPIVERAIYGVANITSLHVSAAIKYLWN